MTTDFDTPDQVEDTFLTGLEAQPLPTENLVSIIEKLIDREHHDVAADWGNMLQSALVETQDPDAGIRLLQARSKAVVDDEKWRNTIKKSLKDLHRQDRLGAVMAENVGFESDTPLDVCFSRLETLRQLKEDVLCYDKTWGVGTVKDLDSFYTRVTVNFEKKRGHEMSFSYAADSLTVLPEHHLLYIKFKEPDRFAQMIKKESGELVKITLSSFGNMTMQQLQERIIENVVDESGWKSFWDRARKALKNDPTVIIPAKRTEQIQLVDRVEEYGDEWFQQLSAERDMETILKNISDYETDKGMSGISDSFNEIIINRLKFVIKGATGTDQVLLTLAIIKAHELGLDSSFAETADFFQLLEDPAEFVHTSNILKARDMQRLVALLISRDAEGTGMLMVAGIPDMEFSLLAETMDRLHEIGGEPMDACRELYRTKVGSRTGSVEMVLWVARRLDVMQEWKCAGMHDIPVIVIDALEIRCGGERLKAKNQLQALFESPEWLTEVIGPQSTTEKRDILFKVRRSNAWDSSDRSTVEARFLKLFPDLNDYLLKNAQAQKKTEDDVIQGGFTSWRRYRERQEQLKQILEVDIPQNSKDIAHARSYGDLRENAEYEAAKDQQGLLMTRQGEIEQELRAIRGTDFTEMDTDKVGMGTTVALKYEDGTDRTVTILGEWDRDEERDIISCRSELAARLQGHSVGDNLQLPTEKGDVSCEIVSITGLSDEIREWVK